MQTGQQLKKRKFFTRPSRSERLTAAVIFLFTAGFFIFCWLAASGKIDIERLFNPCGFKQRFALPCPTCGITTSAVTFASGKIFQAFYIQPAGAFLCSVLAVIGILAFITAVFGVYFDFVKRFFTEVKVRYIILALFVIIAAGWMVTLARALAQK